MFTWIFFFTVFVKNINIIQKLKDQKLQIMQL